MTLDQFIEQLTQLRDHYDAGQYAVMIDTYFWNFGVCYGEKGMDALDGDDFKLDTKFKILEIHANDEF